MWKPIILFSSFFFHEWCLMAIPISDEISVAFVYVLVHFVFLKKKYLIFNFLSDTIDTFEKKIKMQGRVCYAYACHMCTSQN